MKPLTPAIYRLLLVAAGEPLIVVAARAGKMGAIRDLIVHRPDHVRLNGRFALAGAREHGHSGCRALIEAFLS